MRDMLKDIATQMAGRLLGLAFEYEDYRLPFITDNKKWGTVFLVSRL